MAVSTSVLPWSGAWDVSLDYSKPVGGGGVKFLNVRAGDLVNVGGDENKEADWWIGQVVSY